MGAVYYHLNINNSVGISLKLVGFPFGTYKCPSFFQLSGSWRSTWRRLCNQEHLDKHDIACPITG